MKYSGRMAALAATMALAVLPEAWGGNTSSPAYVSLDVESAAIWRTAFSSSVTLKWKMPPTATKATLTVSSATRVASMADLVAESYELQLPPATSAKDENVYTLVLDFDNGHSITGQIGVVTSAAAGASATTSVRSAEDGAWNRFRRSAVALVPHGTTGVTVDGAPAVPYLGGAEGWCVFGAYRGAYDFQAVLSDASGETTADLSAIAAGITITLH